MIVTMRRQISGTRDGVDWPAPGETIEVPDEEAASLIQLGHAEADGVETPADAIDRTTKARKATNEPTL
jgi:hypothetical protein